MSAAKPMALGATADATRRNVHGSLDHLTSSFSSSQRRALASAPESVRRLRLSADDSSSAVISVGRRLAYRFEVRGQSKWFSGTVLRDASDASGRWFDVAFDDGDRKCVRIQGGEDAVWRWLEQKDNVPHQVLGRSKKRSKAGTAYFSLFGRFFVTFCPETGVFWLNRAAIN